MLELPKNIPKLYYSRNIGEQVVGGAINPKEENGTNMIENTQINRLVDDTFASMDANLMLFMMHLLLIG